MHTNTSFSYRAASFVTSEWLLPFSPRSVHWAMLTGFLLLPMATNAAAADFSGSLKEVTITDAQAVNKPPQARFTVTSNGSTFSFDASSSTDPDGSIADYQWDFGNGTKATGVTASTTYTSGTYPVTLTVIDNGEGVALTQQRVNYVEGLVIEDAEDGTTARWRVYDNDPVGATITNEYDTSRQSKVISLAGSGTNNGYSLAKDDGTSLLIKDKSTITFSFKALENYAVYIQLTTSAGVRYLTYSPEDTDRLGTSSYVYYGLGKDSMNGSWKDIIRNLQTDLSNAQSGVTITSIDKILVRGSIKIDDVNIR